MLTVDHPVNGFAELPPPLSSRHHGRKNAAAKGINFGFVCHHPAIAYGPLFPQPPDAALFKGSDGQVADLVNPPRFRLQLVVELLSLLFVPVPRDRLTLFPDGVKK